MLRNEIAASKASLQSFGTNTRGRARRPRPGWNAWAFLWRDHNVAEKPPRSRNRLMRNRTIVVAALAAGLAGCERPPDNGLQAQVDALSARVAALEAKQGVSVAAAPAPHYTLTVTWTTYGQPPATTQTQVATQAACDQAKASTLAEGERLRTNAETQIEADRQRGIISNPIVPLVTAVCSIG